MSEYTERLAHAIASLDELADDALGTDACARLRAKAEGVRLALSYAVEMGL